MCKIYKEILIKSTKKCSNISRFTNDFCYNSGHEKHKHNHSLAKMLERFKYFCYLLLVKTIYVFVTPD